jgi:hypothetical protein
VQWFACGVHFFVEFCVHLQLGFRVLGFRWFAGGVHFFLAEVIYQFFSFVSKFNHFTFTSLHQHILELNVLSIRV